MVYLSEKQFMKIGGDLSGLIRWIGREAEKRHITAYAVGGFVRDLFLKRKNLDLDVVVEADAIAFARQLAGKEKTQLIDHRQFKTATLVWPKGLRVDFATARREYYPYPGSLPVVEPGAIYNDLFRRDFTINAMAVCINPDRFGELVDYFKGLGDLKGQKVRVLHKKSFVDDPTRILRAVRFEQRFGFQIEEETLALLRKALAENAVSSVKLPRYFEEFRKVLDEPQAAKSFKRLADLGGFGFLESGFQWSPSVFLLGEAADRRTSLFEKKFLKGGKMKKQLVHLAILFHQTSERAIEKILSSCNASREEKESALLGKRFNEVAQKLSRTNLHPSRIYEILKPFSQEAVFFFWIKTGNSKVRRSIERFLSRYRKITLTLGGNDLKKLGLSSGQKMGMVLAELLNKKLNGQIRTKRQELQSAKALIQ